MNINPKQVEKKMEKVMYEAPVVEIVEVAVEKGYALSYTDDPADPNGGVD